MALLTKDQIAGADDRKSSELEVPEWGGSIKIRSMSGAQAETYIKSAQEISGLDAVMLLVSFSVVDEKNELMFPSPEDLKVLGEKNMLVMKRVADECIIVNGLNQEVVAEELKTDPSE